MPLPFSAPTQDPGRGDGWSPRAQDPVGGERQPRLRLLYHCDLGRIGEVAAPAGLAAGEWVTLGRNAPGFLGVAPGAARPIADPQVSREQLRVRWRPDLRRFEVAPVAGARRPLGHVEPRWPEGPALRPVAGAALFEPGACLSIGDRVLLGLELGRHRSPHADRLGMVGEGDELWTLRDELRQVARFHRPALVTGPTGAGKELVAHALHRLSDRSGPFVAVNCGALPEALVESALFGHGKGAFTGATSDEKGLFRAAEGGTLFLDELGELPLPVQPKLLRVLQEGVVVPVGSHEPRKVDVRVIAATHRDMAVQVRVGALREDLYHRVAAHVVQVPSLRARRFDVPELFVHLLGGLRAEHPSLDWLWSHGLAWRPALPIGFVADLLCREFPGNVRELQNLVERTARLNLHPEIFRAPELTLSGEERRASPSPRPTASPRPTPSPDSEALAAGLRDASAALGLAHKTVLKLMPAQALSALEADARPEERARKVRGRAAEALFDLLATHDFNQSAVADALGLSRTTLIKLMEQLGLRRAADLDPAEITRALVEARGELSDAARRLRVSPVGLKQRLAQLGRQGAP
jgi:two-component system nitrogen regulation response regulator GlnG